MQPVEMEYEIGMLGSYCEMMEPCIYRLLAEALLGSMPETTYLKENRNPLECRYVAFQSTYYQHSSHECYARLHIVDSSLVGKFECRRSLSIC